MPGTIQVSVMDFQGLPSTSTPQTFFKVSLGKREYQTSQKGDFFFPLTTFRDNLVVKLLDAEGNEIAHTDIQTMSIVQKVSWDENFLFSGGGYVHLKLQFILNEEERTRIRMKREEAMKKRHGNIPLVDEKYSAIASSVGSSVTSSLQGECQVSEKLATEALRNVHSNPVSGKKDSSELVYSRSDISETRSSIPLGRQNEHADKSERQVTLERSPSRVRNLVSAFESSLTKDSKSSVEVPVVTSEAEEVGNQSHLKDYDPKTSSESAKQSSERRNYSFVVGYQKPTIEIASERGKDTDSAKSSFDQASSEMRKTSEKSTESSTWEWAESTSLWERTSFTERAGTSGRMDSDYSERDYFFSVPAEKRYADGTLLEEGRGITNSTKIATRVVSIKKSESLECCEAEFFCSENSGMWIFPNNTKPLCVTTAGKRVMNLLGSVPTENKSHQMEESSSSSPGGVDEEFMLHRSKHEMQKDQKGSQSTRNPRLEGTPDDASGGLFGQVMKIAIIMGFGALVLFTRQREPRKKQRRQTGDFVSNFRVDG